MSRFVRPETATLALSDGDTLIVRKRLTYGEQRASYSRMYMAGLDGRLRVNPFETGRALVVAYLLDWSLCDDDGQRVEIRGQPTETIEGAIDALSPEDFDEIRTAIETHEKAMLAEREAEKKRLARTHRQRPNDLPRHALDLPRAPGARRRRVRRARGGSAAAGDGDARGHARRRARIDVDSPAFDAELEMAKWQ